MQKHGWCVEFCGWMRKGLRWEVGSAQLRVGNDTDVLKPLRLGEGYALRHLGVSDRLPWPELRNIVPRRKLDAELMRMRLVVVVERDALTHLCHGHAHDRVRCRVVRRFPVEDVHPKEALLERLATARKRLLHDKAEQGRETPALTEEVTREHTAKLFTNFCRHKFSRRGLPFKRNRQDLHDVCLRCAHEDRPCARRQANGDLTVLNKCHFAGKTRAGGCNSPDGTWNSVTVVASVSLSVEQVRTARSDRQQAGARPGCDPNRAAAKT